MSALYIHIPFCKQKCYYCNFHFSVSMKNKDSVVNSIIKEIENRKEYLGTRRINSIYFGGGTPSLLEENDLLKIFNQIKKYFDYESDIEITLEANPDDIDINNLRVWKNVGINRLSIGIQSFFDDDLKYMNRYHDGRQAEMSIDLAIEYGFSNLTVDLIYGIPTSSSEKWIQNINKILEREVNHISAYALTVEPKTALDYMIKKKGYPRPFDTNTIEQFELLIDLLENDGFEHYEISNFARKGYIARHNTSYWKSGKYLGIGPSAHSFDGRSRSWNIANNVKYIKALATSEPFCEKEELSSLDKYNEYILTSLRTIWGVEIERIKEFGFYNRFNEAIRGFILNGDVICIDNRCILSRKGKFIADYISSELFIIE